MTDATKLEGFEGRFDTVVDSAFYHVFLDDEAAQVRYAKALHGATKPGEGFEAMERNLDHQRETVMKMQAWKQQLEVIGPLLQNHLAHLPAWSVVASRLD